MGINPRKLPEPDEKVIQYSANVSVDQQIDQCDQIGMPKN